jgi:hypothetical protein
MKGWATIESTGKPLIVQKYKGERGTSAFSQTLIFEIIGAFLSTTRIESE